MNTRVRFNITIYKYIISKAYIALESGIHEYITGAVNECIMIDNYFLELIRFPESIHAATSINVGTVFNKQCVEIGKTIE